MKSKELLAADTTRLTLLEECEHKIGQALRRGLDATCVIGRELRKIDDLELWKEPGYKSFGLYVSDRLQFEARSVARFLDISRTTDRLKAAGLPLPENETQVAELARLDEELQSVVWERVRKAAEIREEPITVYTIRTAIEKETAQPPPPLPAARPGVRTPLDEPEAELGLSTPASGNDGSKGATALPERISLSEDGEAALERIRRFCGDPVAEAIEHFRLQISERELLLWSQQDDPQTLAHYIVNLRWTVAKAIGFESQTVTERTPLGKLFALARAHQGRYEFNSDEASVLVEMAYAKP